MGNLNIDDVIIVTVIITTKNEATNINNCLKSVVEYGYPRDKFEIIVVDNFSIDTTIRLAGAYTNKIYTIGKNRAAQLNYGAMQAKGKYLLYLDADMVLGEGVMAECISVCEEGDYAALYIPESILWSGHFGKVRNFERKFYNATCIDAVRFVKKSKFFEIRGFDEDLLFGLDDWDFDRRIKEVGKVTITKKPLYHNESSITLLKYLKKKSGYMKTFDRYFLKWGKKDPVVKKQFGLFYRYIGVFFEKGKWKKILYHPLLFIQVFLLKILVGIIFIYYRLRRGMAANGYD